MSKARRKKRVYFLMGLFLSWVGSARALPPPGLAGEGDLPSFTPTHKTESAETEEAPWLGEALALEKVLAYAQEHNPAIQAAKSRLSAARQVPDQASAYEDPTVSWEAWNAPENFRIDQANNNIIRLSQKIPFPGKLRLKGEIASKEAERMEAELKAVEIDIVAQLKKAYFDLWLVYQNLEVYRRDRELVAQFARIAEQKYAVGQVSQPDVLRAQVELTRLINRVTTETLALGKARARLNALLSRPPEAPLGMPQSPPAPAVPYAMAELEALALANRPELLAQIRTLEKEGLARDLARKAYYPNFEVSVSRFENFGQRNGFGVGVSASIPLVFKYKYDAAVGEATANLQTAQSELSRLRDLSLFEVKQAFVELQTALEQLDLFLHTHIPQAEQALEASQISYQTGVLDFLSLIDSVRAVEQVHLEHLTAAANFEKAWADLERAVGQELARTALPGTKRTRATGPEGARPSGGAGTALSEPFARSTTGRAQHAHGAQTTEGLPLQNPAKPRSPGRGVSDERP
ncbi:TolC family protein [Methylocaldum sp. BRCS4]|uniref:TolC family protein n=1 Tax=Methylocaldum sp. 14B TaxID=1912213 RepID=UPI00098ACF08|nr:TolC family protein [Methylocaldum sp. 14B]MVF23104.1 TolC family protein [Methylocaldum sp. BRCS4]